MSAEPGAQPLRSGATAASCGGANHSCPPASRVGSSSPSATNRRTRSGCRPAAATRQASSGRGRDAAGVGRHDVAACRRGRRSVDVLSGRTSTRRPAPRTARRSRVAEPWRHHDPRPRRRGRPGVPRGLGMPRPRSRSRRPLDVPGGTVTFASPPGVSTGHRRAQRGLPRRQRQVDVMSRPSTPVARVRGDAHDQVEVARRRRRRVPCPPCAGEPDALPVGDARRDGHVVAARSAGPGEGDRAGGRPGRPPRRSARARPPGRRRGSGPSAPRRAAEHARRAGPRGRRRSAAEPPLSDRRPKPPPAPPAQPAPPPAPAAARPAPGPVVRVAPGTWRKSSPKRRSGGACSGSDSTS